MAKIILKWRYLKPGTKAHGKNMVKYIAKREGVDKIDDTWKVEQVSQAQQKMIDDLLREFPECEDSMSTRTTYGSRTKVMLLSLLLEQ